MCFFGVAWPGLWSRAFGFESWPLLQLSRSRPSPAFIHTRDGCVGLIIFAFCCWFNRQAKLLGSKALESSRDDLECSSSLQNFSECGSAIRKRSFEQQFVANRSVDTTRCWCSWRKKNFIWCVTMTGGHKIQKTSLGIFMQMKASQKSRLLPRNRIQVDAHLPSLASSRTTSWKICLEIYGRVIDRLGLAARKKCKQLVDNRDLLVVIRGWLRPRFLDSNFIYLWNNSLK